MGASKRAAELIVQSLGIQDNNTTFSAVRFGNVIASNGSVIPRFMSQINNGGPVTVTHQDVERYFMSIPEASRLVLRASSLSKGDEIFILNMGEAIKILDLAKLLIKRSGKVLGKDIEIVFSGLKKGEKLNEELFYNQAKVGKTDTDKIFVSQRAFKDVDFLKKATLLVERTIKDPAFDYEAELSKIIPSYVPENSDFVVDDSKDSDDGTELIN
jgi:FlaA1/EpsC-like NDP-sugar epimerase